MRQTNTKSPLPNIKQGTEINFAADVMEASLHGPVIAYFTASWCGPCKAFGPMLERSVRECGADLTLIKYDIDRCRRLAAQLHVQSVPTVFGFYGGKIESNFTGAQPVSSIKKFIEKLVTISGQSSSGNDGRLAEAEQLLEAGSAFEALQLFAKIFANKPDSAVALCGLVKANIALGNLDMAESILSSAAEDIVNESEVLAAKSALDLARQAAEVGPVNEIRERVKFNPDDYEGRFELAVALLAANKIEEAINELLELYRRNREWGEGAAQAQLFKIFETLKPNDPVALKGRRRLSSMIFS